MLKIEYTLKDIDTVAKKILQQSTSKTFLFKAEMGVGKTTLIKALVKALGSNDTVSSPTFSLVNEYQSNTETIYHFDLYRVEDQNELYDFGIEDYLDTEAYLFVEWPQLAENLFTSYNTISISLEKDSFRILKMTEN